MQAFAASRKHEEPSNKPCIESIATSVITLTPNTDLKDARFGEALIDVVGEETLPEVGARLDEKVAMIQSIMHCNVAANEVPLDHGAIEIDGVRYTNVYVGQLPESHRIMFAEATLPFEGWDVSNYDEKFKYLSHDHLFLLKLVRDHYWQLDHIFSPDEIDELFVDLNSIYDVHVKFDRFSGRYEHQRFCQGFIYGLPNQLAHFKKAVDRWVSEMSDQMALTLGDMKIVIQRYGDIYKKEKMVKPGEGQRDPRFADFFFHQNFKEIDIESQYLNPATFWVMLEAAAKSFYNTSELVTYNEFIPGEQPQHDQSTSAVPMKTRGMQISPNGVVHGSNTFLDVFDKFRNLKPLQDPSSTFGNEIDQSANSVPSIGHVYHGWKQNYYKDHFDDTLLQESDTTHKSYYGISKWWLLKRIVYNYHDLLAILFPRKVMSVSFLSVDAHFMLVCQKIIENDDKRLRYDDTPYGRMSRSWRKSPWSLLQIIEDTLPSNYGTFMQLVEQADIISKNIFENFCEYYRIERTNDSFVGYRDDECKEYACHWNKYRIKGLMTRNEPICVRLETAAKKYYRAKLKSLKSSH